ncbi:helix-turn-helix transcriptional regulator [Paenibacillus alkalitolerans]|uniref:helix-turn-helix transcriptional regulator n=1 Tax=Paenibacillus alkalitolerans TaxID=2799335 RepID=UPI0018F403F2|nr:AraC family transcriptional regulator [Paenibacillus alkalitolerans]
MRSTYRERASHAWTDDSVRLVMTPSAFAKSALFYVQEIGYFRTLPTYFTERERLDSFLIVYTKSGRGRLTYMGKNYTMLPRHIFFIDCMEYQYYAIDSAEPWELLWVHMNGQSVRAYFERFVMNGGPVRALPPESDIPAILEELIELHRIKSIRNELLASKSIAGLLTSLLLSGSEPESLNAGMPEYIAETTRLIDKRYNEKLTLDLLSKTLAVNKYHLAKEFKKHTGFSPGEYIINTRISRAKELLQYSNLSVAEIAEKIGIDNVSHFINLFKYRTEQTPLAFRKTWQLSN